MRMSILFCLLLLLPVSALADNSRLLFDQSHRQAFLAEGSGPLQLSELAATFQRQNIQVAVSTDQLTRSTLENFNALVISGAFAPHSEAEIDAILTFLDRGGKLAIMVHIGQPLLPLLHKLGVAVGSNVINDIPDHENGRAIDLVITNLKQHPLTYGLDHFSIYGGWPLQAIDPQRQVLASSSPSSWIDLNQDQQLSTDDLVTPFPVMISGTYGRGSFVIYADDAIFQNKFLQGPNKTLAENLARWLATPQPPLVEI